MRAAKYFLFAAGILILSVTCIKSCIKIDPKVQAQIETVYREFHGYLVSGDWASAYKLTSPSFQDFGDLAYFKVYFADLATKEYDLHENCFLSVRGKTATLNPRNSDKYSTGIMVDFRLVNGEWLIDDTTIAID